MEDQLIETWAIHNRINLYFLDAVADDALGASLPPKSRTVYDLFAHIHNVRLMWLKAAAPELLDGLKKLETKTVGKKARAVHRRSVFRAGDREVLRQGAGRRRQDQGIQAARGRVSRLLDLPRVPPPRPGRVGPQSYRGIPWTRRPLSACGNGACVNPD